MSVSLNPIGPWPLVAVAAAAVTILTIWAYLPRLRGGDGPGTMAGLRPPADRRRPLPSSRCSGPRSTSPEKKKQPAALIFLLDRSKSLDLHRRGQRPDPLAGRRQGPRGRAEDGRRQARRTWRSRSISSTPNSTRRRPTRRSTPDGRETALGAGLLEAVKRQVGPNVADDRPDLRRRQQRRASRRSSAADQLKGKLIPVVTVGVGDENAGADSKDIAIRDFEAGPTVFVKNQPEIRGDDLRTRLREQGRSRSSSGSRARGAGRPQDASSPRPAPRSSTSPG